MRLLAVIAGLWGLLALCLSALIARTSAKCQDRDDDVPAVDAGGPSKVVEATTQARDRRSDDRYFRAIAAAEEQRQTFERSGRDEDRDRFLATMSVLVRLGDAWVTHRPPSMGMPEDVRATLLRCIDARDEQLPTVAASNDAWKLVARAVSHARTLPDVRDVDRDELGRLEEQAWTHVSDLATVTHVSDFRSGRSATRDA